MLKLDRAKAFGTVTPPWQPDDCDRPAHYEQDGKLFDSHDRVIEPGKPLKVEVSGGRGQGSEEEHPSPAELIRQADTLPWAKFQKEAKRILGKTCPAGKSAILGALKGAIADYEMRSASRRSVPSTPVENPGKPAVEHSGANGMSWGTLTGEHKGGIDLAAWGRGQKDYVFGEVTKAMRAKYHVQFTERRDVRDFLIDQGVIQAAEARQDV